MADQQDPKPEQRPDQVPAADAENQVPEGAAADQAAAPEGDAQAVAGADGAEDGATASTAADDSATAAPQAAESNEDKLLDEIQRLAAEYKNYRQRTESQRELDHARAVGDAAKKLFPVFDDLDRAETNGDLTEGSAFATIAAKVRAIGTSLGIERFGAAGEKFDPQRHAAVLQQPRPDIEEEQIGQVIEPGYQLGDLMLRAAKVVVFTPSEK